MRLDVGIVGGGPAGLACALELKARSPELHVAVFDRRTPPLDKPCGEGLMPDGVLRLRELGVEMGTGDPESLRCMPFRGIRWLDDEADPALVVEGRFPADAGLGIRRLELHRALVAAAESAGVELHWGRKALGPTPADDRGRRGLRLATHDREETVTPRYVVAADGLRSPLRHALGLAGRPGRRSRFGVRRHLAVAPWTDCVEVHWGDGFEAYVTPVAPDEVGVAFLWSDRKADWDELLDGLPKLRERLAGAPVRSRDRGTGPLRQRVTGVVRGNVALVGDAAGYVDAITGEGLSVALHQAHALAEAVAQGDLAAYGRQCRSLDRTARWLTELLLGLQERPLLRRRAFRALARDPELFDRFLAIHVREAPLSRLLSLSPRLVWRLLTV